MLIKAFLTVLGVPQDSLVFPNFLMVPQRSLGFFKFLGVYTVFNGLMGSLKFLGYFNVSQNSIQFKGSLRFVSFLGFFRIPEGYFPFIRAPYYAQLPRVFFFFRVIGVPSCSLGLIIIVLDVFKKIMIYFSEFFRNVRILQTP